MTDSRLKPVSIIVPTKNRGHYLPDLLRNLLNLNYPEFEIIIVDDCSADNTSDLLKQYPVRSILLKKSSGSANARNLGIKEAKYDIIALTDSDCFVSRNWLIDLVPYLNTYDVVGGKVIFSDDIEKKLNPFIENETILTKDSPVNFLNTCNMVLNKETWKSSHGFLSYRLEDVEFSWRLLQQEFTLYYVPKGLVIHQGKRTPFQNFKKYLQYGKSYSELSYLHKIAMDNKSARLSDNQSIFNYSKLILYLVGIYIALFISTITISNLLFSISFLTLSLFLFTYLIFRIMKKIDILYRLYKVSIFFSIVVYMIIYMLKS
ncbi:MAG: glycosyltransferase [Candidatus Hermodarchaeota archaeon]